MIRKNYKLSAQVIILAVILTTILTWPFALNIGSYFTDHGDYTIHASIFWYNQDSIKTGRIFNQTEYFNGYMFYPLPYTLAYANNSFLPSLIFAPVYWITGNLPFSFNFYIILTFILSFIASFYAFNYFVKNTWACLIGAFVFTFNAATMVRFPQHVDTLGKYFLPLIFLFFYKFLDKPGFKNSWWFFLIFTANALTANYYFIASLILLPFVSLPFLLTNLIKKNRMYFVNLLKFSLVFLIFIPVILYFDLPYLEFAQKEGIFRPVESVFFFSARVTDYLAASPDNLIYKGWVESLEKFRDPRDPNTGIFNYEEHTLFLGILPTVLFFLGLKLIYSQKIRKSFFYILLLLTFTFTFGPFFFVFKYFYQVVPFMQGIRSATRFEYLFLVPFGLIVSYGALWLFKKLRNDLWIPIFIGMTMLLILENFTAKDFTTRSHILETIERIGVENLNFLKGKGVLHLPIYSVDGDFGHNSSYITWLTQTGEKIVNSNLSAHIPPDQLMLMDKFRSGLKIKDLEILQLLDVSFIVIHKDLFSTGLDGFSGFAEQTVYSDYQVMILEISKFNLSPKACVLERDFDIQLVKGRDENFNISNVVVLKNKGDCTLVSPYQDRYRTIDVNLEGQEKKAHLKFPVVIEPGEQVVLSEINREFRVE